MITFLPTLQDEWQQKVTRQQEIREKLLSKNEEGLEVVEVEGKGKGVVATRCIKKDDLICEYSGELLPQKEAKKREEVYSENPEIGCFMYFFSHKERKWWYVLCR